jgi:mRNA interferase YafQ
MRTIRHTKQFRRDVKRQQSRSSSKSLKVLLGPIIEMLARDEELPRRLADHPLVGEWSSCRDCHIRPDLVLIYRKRGDDTLELLRLGSHSELGF